MAYNANIPQATDIPANSQPQILGNFKLLAPVGNGYLDLTNQTTQPPTLPLFFPTTDTALYNYSYTATGSMVANNETFIQTQVKGGASQAQIPMTASTLSNTAPTPGLSGWTYLPSGILLKWGKFAITSGPAFVTLNIDSTSGGPAYTNLFSVQVTPYQTNNAPPPSMSSQVGSISGTNTQVSITNSSVANATGVYYFAIGM